MILILNVVSVFIHVYVHREEMCTQTLLILLKNTGVLQCDMCHKTDCTCCIRFFKNDQRHLCYLSETLDRGNVCPACPKVCILCVSDEIDGITFSLRKVVRLCMRSMGSLGFHAKRQQVLAIGNLLKVTYFGRRCNEECKEISST